MIVVDASSAVSALLNVGPARQALAEEQVHVPHLIDPEVANALRRGVAASRIEPGDAWTALDTGGCAGSAVPGCRPGRTVGKFSVGSREPTENSWPTLVRSHLLQCRSMPPHTGHQGCGSGLVGCRREHWYRWLGLLAVR